MKSILKRNSGRKRLLLRQAPHLFAPDHAYFAAFADLGPDLHEPIRTKRIALMAAVMQSVR